MTGRVETGYSQAFRATTTPDYINRNSS